MLGDGSLQRLAGEQQPDEQRADERLADEPVVHAGSSPRFGALQHLLADSEPFGPESLTDVMLSGRSFLTARCSSTWPVGVLMKAAMDADQGVQVAAQRTGVGRRDRGLDLAERGVEDEVRPGPPAPVDRGLVHPGPLGHVADRQVIGRARQQEVERRAQHRSTNPGAAAAGPAGLGRRRGHGHVTDLIATHFALTATQALTQQEKMR